MQLVSDNYLIESSLLFIHSSCHLCYRVYNSQSGRHCVHCGWIWQHWECKLPTNAELPFRPPQGA